MSILQMSISAGLLVIAIVIIRAVALNRLPKKMFLVLWGVVLIRLLVPASIPINIGVGSAFGGITDLMEEIIGVRGTAVITVVTPEVTEVPYAAGQPTEVARGRLINIAPTTAIWLAGMSAVFIFLVVVYLKNQKVVRFATAIRDNDYLNEWLAENKLLRSITIMHSDRIISPLAVGIFKPRIILPKSMDMSNKQLLDYVLAHEYYHIKRLDALWKVIMLLALCVHWFNPLVWVMFVLANRDLELTCDEAVIYRFGATTKKAYAYLLIGMAEHRGGFALQYNGFSKNATQERIVSVMKVKKKSALSMMLAVVLVATLTVGSMTTVLAAAGQSETPTLLNPSASGQPIRDRIAGIVGNDLTNQLFAGDTLSEVDALLGEGAAQLLLGWYFQQMYDLYGGSDVVFAIMGVENVALKIGLIFDSLGVDNGMEQLLSLNMSQRLLYFAPYLSWFLTAQTRAQHGENRIRERMTPANSEPGRALFDRMKPLNDEFAAQWDRNNPFAPIIVGEPIVPDSNILDNATLIRPGR